MCKTLSSYTLPLSFSKKLFMYHNPCSTSHHSLCFSYSSMTYVPLEALSHFSPHTVQLTQVTSMKMPSCWFTHPYACTHICCANGPVQFLSMHTPFPTHPHTLMHHIYMWQNINTLMVYTHTFKCKVCVCPSELAFAHALYLIELFKQPLILFSFISVPY